MEITQPNQQFLVGRNGSKSSCKSQDGSFAMSSGVLARSYKQLPETPLTILVASMPPKKFLLTKERDELHLGPSLASSRDADDCANVTAWSCPISKLVRPMSAKFAVFLLPTSPSPTLGFLLSLAILVDACGSRASFCPFCTVVLSSSESKDLVSDSVLLQTWSLL